MHLIEALAAGVRGCENGTVRLFDRGTTTRASYYLDFEGTAQDSSGADVQLDAYGGAIVYAASMLTVECYSSLGVLVRSFTAGVEASSVEVRSDAFLGTDYETGASALRKPLTLQQVFDLLTASLEGADWQVLVGGGTKTFADAFGSLARLVVNVQSPEFGGVGDGVTDDTAAIQAALSAALLAANGSIGAIVFFPPGVYLTTSVITWDRRVHIVMVPGASLAINHATAGILKLTSANTDTFETVFYGVGFKALQANTGAQLSIEASQRLRLVQCTFGMNANSTGTCIASTVASASLSVEDCRFRLNGSTQQAHTCAADYTERLQWLRSTVVFPATYGTLAIVLRVATGGIGRIEGNLFDGLTNVLVLAAGTGPVRMLTGEYVVTNNRFTGAFTYGLFADSSGPIRARGNEFGASVATRYSVPTLAAGSFLELDQIETLTNPGTAFTLSQYTEYTEVSSSAAAPTITIPDGLYYGQKRYVLLHNNGSGAGWAAVAYVATGNLRLTTLAATVVPNNARVMDIWVWSLEAGGWLKISTV